VSVIVPAPAPDVFISVIVLRSPEFVPDDINSITAHFAIPVILCVAAATVTVVVLHPFAV
jgi:hypothetical protein